MSTVIDTFTPVNQLEYHSHFWNYLMGKEGHKTFLELGRNITGAYALPTTSSKKFGDKLKTESMFRQLATVHYAPGGPSTILAKVKPTLPNRSTSAVRSTHTMPSTISAHIS